MKKSKAVLKKPTRDSSRPMNSNEAQNSNLVLRNDLAAKHYAKATVLIKKRRLEKAERDFLDDFESLRQRIARDSAKVEKQGYESAFRGLEMLEYLIHEKHLQKLQDMEDDALYGALCDLSELMREVREAFVGYAAGGSRFACTIIFLHGKAFAEAFSRLAIVCPDHFQEIAKRSLLMPSLRARNPAFTCDAEAIATAIHLAEDHHASNIHDNRSRIGALCHQFMAWIVDLVEAVRLERKPGGDTKDSISRLPELRGNAKTWWEVEIKGWVALEFEKMRKNPLRNPALWQELQKATNHGTPSAMRATFEKYCRNKLDQIAGKAQAQA